jgi:hypothetical protein
VWKETSPLNEGRGRYHKREGVLELARKPAKNQPEPGFSAFIDPLFL